MDAESATAYEMSHAPMEQLKTQPNAKTNVQSSIDSVRTRVTVDGKWEDGEVAHVLVSKRGKSPAGIV